MNNKHTNQLAEARAMLADANSLNENGKHGVAFEKAYHASELIAVAYLSVVTSQVLPPNDAPFDLFAKTIQEPNRHSKFQSEIDDVVGDVYVLREAYKSARLNETTTKDAHQMIDRVEMMLDLVGKIYASASSI